MTLLIPDADKIYNDLLIPLNEKIRVFRYKYFFKKYQIFSRASIPDLLRENSFTILLVPFFIISQFFHVYFSLKKRKPDIILAFWYTPQAYIAIFTKRILRSKTKVICIVPGSDLLVIENYLKLHRAFTRLFGYPDLTVTVSEDSCDRLRRIIKSKDIRVISAPIGYNDAIFHFNAIDLQEKRERLAKIQSYRFLFVGRLVEQKGPDLALSIFEKLKSKYPGSTLQFVGEGAYKTVLEDTISPANSSSITFHGRIDSSSVANIMRSTDILIAPSRFNEGLPTTIQEAIACGMYPICTSIGGVKQIIDYANLGEAFLEESLLKIDFFDFEGLSLEVFLSRCKAASMRISGYSISQVGEWWRQTIINVYENFEVHDFE